MKMKCMSSLLLILILASPIFALDGTVLLKQVDRNLNPESYEMYRKLINVEPDGSKKEFTLFSLKKGSDKIAALFIAPASENGRSTLRLGDNMWLYIPNVGKPVRITSLQSVVGGVFNNADILNLDYAVEYNVSGVEDAGNEYLLHLKAKTRSVAMISSGCGWIRTRSCRQRSIVLPRRTCSSRPSTSRSTKILEAVSSVPQS